MPPQPQQPLPLCAEGVQAHGCRPTVGPEDAVPLDRHLAAEAVLRRVAAEEGGQRASHVEVPEREGDRVIPSPSRPSLPRQPAARAAPRSTRRLDRVVLPQTPLAEKRLPWLAVPAPLPACRPRVY